MSKMIINQTTEGKSDKDYARLALSLMDLTSLNDNDSDDIIHNLCLSSNTSFGQTAAVCIYPQFIKLAKATLDDNYAQQVQVATVTNFPHGGNDIKLAIQQTKVALQDGADEIDVVFPYRALLAGDEKVGVKLVNKCKKQCIKYGAKLKVIIESGELKSSEMIKKASEMAIVAGADFIKTSTGKVPINATLEAAEIMLNVIKNSDQPIGFKAAGGIGNVADAKNYLQLAECIMGVDWISRDTFRFGASGLLSSLLATLNDEVSIENMTSY